MGCNRVKWSNKNRLMWRFLLVICMCLAAIGQAVAADAQFPNDGVLYQAVYEKSGEGTEAVTQLCAISDLAKQNVIIRSGNAENVSLDAFPNTNDWGDLSLEICGYEGSSYPYTGYFAKTTTSAFGKIGDRSASTFRSGVNRFTLFYRQENGANVENDYTRSTNTSGSDSYVSGMCKGGKDFGGFTGLNMEQTDGSASLGPLHSENDGYVDMFVFAARFPDSRSCELVDAQGNPIQETDPKQYIAIIRLKREADGGITTILNPAISNDEKVEIDDIDDQSVEEGSQFSLAVTGKNASEWMVDTSPATNIYVPAGYTRTSCNVVWSVADASVSPVSVTVTAKGAGLEESKTFTLTVTPKAADASPSLAPIGPRTATAGVEFNYQAEVENGVTPDTWGLVNEPAGMAIDTTGMISWPSPEEGTYDITVKASNAEGGDNISFTLTVDPASTSTDAPDLKSIPAQTKKAGSSFSYQVEVENNVTPDTWGLDNEPTGMTIDATGLISWPSPEEGTYSITVKASKGKGEGTTTLTLTVNAQVSPTPVIENIPDHTIGEGTAYNGPIPTVSSGTADTWTLDQACLGKGMTIDETTGRVSWNTPVAGTHTITITAVDETSSQTATESWRLTVTPGKDDMKIHPILNQSGVEGTPFAGPLPSFDSGEADAWTVLVGPQGMKIDSSSGKVTWPSPLQGDWPVTIKAINTNLNKSTTVSFYINVSPPPVTRPVIRAIPNVEIIAGEAFSLTPEDTLKMANLWQLTATPNITDMNFEESTGSLTWDDPAAGEYEIQLTAVNTRYAQKDTESFVLTVIPQPVNFPPYKPVPHSPKNREVVSKPKPTLITDPAADPEEDALFYVFEVYGDSSLDTLIARSEPVSNEWWDVDISLEDGLTCFWRVQAVDEKGAAGDWSEPVSFTMNLAPYLSPPVIVVPRSGAYVESLTPTLSLIRGKAGAEVPVGYEFEIYADPTLTDPVIRYTVPPPSADKTGTNISWTIPQHVLSDLSTYYWRARTNYPASKSSWMDTAAFTVDTEKEGTIVNDVVSETNQNIKIPGMPRIITVNDSKSILYGLILEVPEKAIDDDYDVTVYQVLNGPEMQGNVKSRGIIADFSPSGVQFGEPVTIRFPYTEEDLDTAQINDPEDLEMLTYNPLDEAWERVPECYVDIYDDMVVCETIHFSMYAIGKMYEDERDDAGMSTESADCFIRSLFFTGK